MRNKARTKYKHERRYSPAFYIRGKFSKYDFGLENKNIFVESVSDARHLESVAWVYQEERGMRALLHVLFRPATGT